MGTLLHAMYPAMVVKRRASNDIRVNLYNGITIKELDSGPFCLITVEFDSKKIGDIAQNMDFSVLEMSKMAVKLRLDSGYRANGNIIFFKCYIRGKCMDFRNFWT